MKKFSELKDERRCDTDFQLENHGSIILFRPLTDLASSWLEAHVDDYAQYFGSALAVEPRYAEGLISVMRSDGLGVGLMKEKGTTKNTRMKSREERKRVREVFNQLRGELRSNLSPAGYNNDLGCGNCGDTGPFHGLLYRLETKFGIGHTYAGRRVTQ